MTTLLEHPSVQALVTRMSVADYHKLGELGLLPEKIELILSKNRAPYFISKPMVEKNSIKTEKTGQVKASFTCIINKELIAELLSFGSDVIVLGPTSLKTRI